MIFVGPTVHMVSVCGMTIRNEKPRQSTVQVQSTGMIRVPERCSLPFLMMEYSTVQGTVRTVSVSTVILTVLVLLPHGTCGNGSQDCGLYQPQEPHLP